MKYQISAINQAGVVDAGLHEKTDVIDWVLLDYIFAWQLSPTAKRLDDKFWINYAHLISEMPLLGLNSKGAVANRIKKIRDLGLIETFQHPVDCRLYAKTTAFYYEITQFRAVEKPLVGVHQNEQGVHQNEQGVHQNEQGVHQNEHSTVNHYPLTKSSKEKSEDAPKKIEKVAIEEPVKVVKFDYKKFETPAIIDRDLWDEWQEIRRKKGKQMTERACVTYSNALVQVHEMGLDVKQALEHACVRGWEGMVVQHVVNAQSVDAPKTNKAMNAGKPNRDFANPPKYSLDDDFGDSIESFAVNTFTQIGA